MTTTLEQCARAICRADLKDGGDFESAWENESEVWISEARAVLQSLAGNVSEAMVEAGLSTSTRFGKRAMKNIFTAMLAAAAQGGE